MCRRKSVSTKEDPPTKCTTNALLRPTPPLPLGGGGLFISNSCEERGLIETGGNLRGGAYFLAKTVVSVLLKELEWLLN